MLGLDGDAATILGAFIPKVVLTSSCKDFFAVAVKAITFTEGGIRLRTSPIL